MSRRYSYIQPGAEHAGWPLDIGTSANMLIVFQPAGFNRFQAEPATMADPDFEDGAMMKALKDNYDIVNMGPVPDRPSQKAT